MRFDSVIGQAAALTAIRAALDRGRLPHAFLFHGRRGTGKTTTALALARLLECQSPAGPEPCEKCPACHQSRHFNHPDIMLLPPTPSAPDTQAGEAQRTEFITEAQASFQKAPIFVLDESRPLEHRIATMRWLKHEASRAAVTGPWKVFILKQAGAMNVEAANAILKLLEEPNSGTLLILGVERPGDLPETIKSRCALVRFRDLATTDVVRLLGERLPKADPGAMALAARLARGSLTRAAALIVEDVLALRDEAIGLVTAPPTAPDLHRILDGWLRERDRSRLDLLFDLMLLWYRDLLRVAVGVPDSADGLANADRLAELERWAGRLTPSDLASAVRRIEEARRSVDGYGYLPLVLYSLVERLPRGPAPRRSSPGQRVFS